MFNPLQTKAELHKLEQQLRITLMYNWVLNKDKSIVQIKCNDKAHSNEVHSINWTAPDSCGEEIKKNIISIEMQLPAANAFVKHMPCECFLTS